MISRIRQTFLFLTLATYLEVLTPSVVTKTLAQPRARMENTGLCANRGAGCVFAGPHVNAHVHLGSFRGDFTMPPFDITVKKSELVEDRTYTLTVESQISTGYQWMCLGVLDEKEHEDVAGRHHEYYREVLTKAVMEEAARFGKTMHGITVTPFSMHSGGAAVENRGGANCVGQSEISKASFTVSRDIAEGTYYVVMGYGSAFRGPTITSFKEVRVRVEP